MAEAVKKLTVSYGAFSCTLEGFDDPFPVMKMVVDYFQSLAERDPSFGAHPERPDADYLRNLAQRGTNHNVEIETQDNGVILRQTYETMAETADVVAPLRGATLSLVPRSDRDDTAAVMAADYADEMFSTIDRQEFPAAMTAAFRDDPYRNGAPAQEVASVYDREERALERLLSAARLRSGADETLASSNPMTQLKESLKEDSPAQLFEDAPLSQATPDSDLIADLIAPVAEPTVYDAVSEPKIEMIGFGTVPQVEFEDAVEAEVEETDQGEQTEISAPNEPMSDEQLVSQASIDVGAADAKFDLPEDVTPDEADPVEAEISAPNEPIADEQLVSQASADVVEVDAFDDLPEDVAHDEAERAEFEIEIAALASVELAEPAEPAELTDSMLEHGTPVELSPNDDDAMALPFAEDSAPTPPRSFREDFEQAEGQQAAVKAEPHDIESAAQVQDPAEFDWNGEATPVEPVVTAAPMPLLVLGPALMVVGGSDAVLDDVDPLEATVETASEGTSRRQIVRTRPAASDFDYDAAQRNDPQSLASDAPEKSQDDESDDEAAEITDGITLDNFARKVGAASLPELLEASAAYVTIVSGQPRFSRASILNMVDELSDERSYTQEARIKSFGKLLRNGSILRVEDGKFAISHSAKFNYEVKISA